jgi:hypothetical protein
MRPPRLRHRPFTARRRTIVASLNGAGHRSMSMSYRSPWGEIPQSGTLRGQTPRRRGWRFLPPPRGLTLYLAISALGVASFLGLLIASHYLPHYAGRLRLSGLALLLFFGLVRTVMFWRRL